MAAAGIVWAKNIQRNDAERATMPSLTTSLFSKVALDDRKTNQTKSGSAKAAAHHATSLVGMNQSLKNSGDHTKEAKASPNRTANSLAFSGVGIER